MRAPRRVNIHALDPVYIVAKIGFTPFMERINVWDVLGIQSQGKRGWGALKQKVCYGQECPLSQLLMNEQVCYKIWKALVLKSQCFFN